jgi:hypothetical protein
MFKTEMKAEQARITRPKKQILKSESSFSAPKAA